MPAFQPPRPKFASVITTQHLLSAFAISTITTIVGLHWFLTFYETHIPFNTTINGVAVENMTAQEATEVVEKSLPMLEQQTFKLSFNEISLASPSSELGYTHDIDTAVKTAFAQYEDRTVIGKIRHLVERLDNKQDIIVKPTLDKDKTLAFVQTFASNVDIEGEEPTATLTTSGSPNTLKILPGKHGRAVNQEKTTETMQYNAGDNTFQTTATVEQTNTVLTEADQVAALTRAKKFVGVNQTLEYDTTRIFITDKDLLALLTFPEGIDIKKVDTLVATWAERVERKPQNAVFEYDKNVLTVAQFQPPREGIALESDIVKQHVTSLMHTVDTTTDEKQVEKKLPTTDLPVKTTEPSISLAKTNELGIHERLGVGESWYRGSIPSRIHNVGLAASRIANYIVKPGEEFSFNTAVGDVSASTGFQSAYVIMNGQTVLGDGGGVCQVSTTLFRALLNSGIQITRRLPHSYRVGYYEQNGVPGIDATVFSGNVDLRFKNDTPGHILIHTRADSKNQYMIVELYGTSDGRTAELIEIKQWDAVPALPPQYIPDPSLAPGQLRQIDWAVGGLKTSFRHIVKDKNGKVITDKVYTSNYRPWAAKYLQGV